MKSPLRNFGQKQTPPHSYRTYEMGKSKNSRILYPVFVLAFLALVLQLIWSGKNKEKFVDKGVQHIFTGVTEAEIMPVLCYYCQGTGLVNAENPALEGLCPICFGTGRNEVRVLEEREMICDRCRGMGRLFEGDQPDPCPDCQGRGLRVPTKVKAIGGKQIQYLRIECEVCMGSGLIIDPKHHVKVMCPTCYGIGWNAARRVSDREGLCPACGGMGRIFDRETASARPCKRCGERGLILLETPQQIPEKDIVREEEPGAAPEESPGESTGETPGETPDI